MPCKREVSLSQEDASRRHELIALDKVCEYCGALHWLDERAHFAGRMTTLHFCMCCYNGKAGQPEL